MEQSALFAQPVHESAELDNISKLLDRLDFLDIQILRKFYMTGKEFPSDTQPYCFPLLFKEMRESHHLKIGLEALRKRLHILTNLGFLEKIKHSNPTSYGPIEGKESLIRAIVLKFFVINGLTKFL